MLVDLESIAAAQALALTSCSCLSLLANIVTLTAQNASLMEEHAASVIKAWPLGNLSNSTALHTSRPPGQMCKAAACCRIQTRACMSVFQWIRLDSSQTQAFA